MRHILTNTEGDEYNYVRKTDQYNKQILFKKNRKFYLHNMKKKLLHLTSALALGALSLMSQAQPETPNFVVIFVDDLGYGDLSCFGHPTIMTPNLDQMADEGMRFTQFYVGASICTPSRAAILTGRLPVRSGMSGSDNSGNVLYPRSTGGLPQSELTIAEALKSKDYATGIVGKWHVGHLPEFLPLNNGFDYYFGLPYSNDMVPSKKAYRGAPELPLYENEKVIESDPDQWLLTKRYTDKAIQFIKKNKNKPFFLYYTNNFPHTPLHASDDFKGTSKRGLYGDVVAELDWSVGEILNTLKELQIDKNTFVFFTSDNGPWLRQQQDGGSAGLLFEGKASAYEGGFRVPAIAWWPGMIKPGQTNTAIATSMDLYPTLLNLAGVPLPDDRMLDGNDILPLLTGQKKAVSDVVYYYYRDKLYAVRKGPWKAHFITRKSYSPEPPVVHEVPVLFNLDVDPSEKYDVSAGHPEMIEEMRQVYEAHRATVDTTVFSQLDPGYKR